MRRPVRPTARQSCCSTAGRTTSTAIADVAPLLAAKGYRVHRARPCAATARRASCRLTAVRNGQQAALAADVHRLAWMRSGSSSAIVAGFDWGARTAEHRCGAVAGALQGAGVGERLPDRQPGGRTRSRCRRRPSSSGGTSSTSRPSAAAPATRQYRRDFAKLIWQTASPQWHFDDATFERSAAAFDNPDHVSIVIHNYRWRLGLAEGEPNYDDLERRLAAGPAITVPTITLEGDANGAPHPDPAPTPRSSRASTSTGS